VWQKYLAKGQPMRLNNLNSVNLKKLAAIVGLQLEHGGRELQLNLVKSLISSTSMDVSRDVFGYSNFQKRSCIQWFIIAIHSSSPMTGVANQPYLG